eukprot:3670575-Pyramimonas_sp.AAC.1
MENQPTPPHAEGPSQALRNRGQGAADLHARWLDATGHTNADWAASREADGPMRSPPHPAGPLRLHPDLA